MDLVQTGAEKRIVVLGNPGAGKSTLVRQLCLTMLDSDESGLPVYLELKRYQPDRGRDVRSLYQAQLRELQSRSPGTRGRRRKHYRRIRGD
jgi:GTPase SAR1 family protein